MKDIPIIYSGPMIRALWSDLKTKTRRLAWRDAEFGLQDYSSEQLEEMDASGWSVVGEGNEGLYRVYKPTAWQSVKPGDRLWVKENFRTAFTLDKKSMQAVANEALDAGYRRPWCPIKYEADGTTDNWTATDWGEFGKQRPCIFMPRWASRLTLIVTATKIERLQDISENDARAEGVTPIIDHGVGNQHLHRIAFEQLWCALHGDGAWVQNPEVVALTLTVHKTNIDAMPRAAA